MVFSPKPKLKTPTKIDQYPRCKCWQRSLYVAKDEINAKPTIVGTSLPAPVGTEPQYSHRLHTSESCVELGQLPIGHSPYIDGDWVMVASKQPTIIEQRNGKVAEPPYKLYNMVTKEIPKVEIPPKAEVPAKPGLDKLVGTPPTTMDWQSEK